MIERNPSQSPRSGKRCAVCDGKFGLIRHYSWRTLLLFQEVRRSLQSSPGK
jgi:hypothetical protein